MYFCISHYDTAPVTMVQADDIESVSELANCYPNVIYFEAELVPPMDELTVYEPTRWWRVLDTDGALWCETSSEKEARNELRESHLDDDDDLVYGALVEGRKLQRLFKAAELAQWKWKAVD